MVSFGQKMINKDKIATQKLVRKQVVLAREERSFNYQRVLGHPEIINGQHWRENTELDCQLCEKRTQCIFLFNKRLAHQQPNKFYNHDNSEPLELLTGQAYDHPILYSTDGQIARMIPVKDFIERLGMFQGVKNSRTCNNQFEEIKIKEIRDTIMADFNETERVQATYTNLIKKHSGKETSLSVIELMNWHQTLESKLPCGIYTPFKLDSFSQEVKKLYKKDEAQELLADTYCCSLFIKASSTFNIKGVAIKLPSQKGIHYVEQLMIDDNKQMNVNHTKPKFKLTKKQAVVLKFDKPTSVFALWNDPQRLIDVAFETDMEFVKFHRFIKCPDTINEVKAYLKERYRDLNSLFLNLICCQSYPTIGWLKFTEYCHQWKIYDRFLTTPEVDQSFIAANYQSTKLENNDEHNLVRYEFVELLVRLAKVKYFDKKVHTSLALSVRIFLENFVFANNLEAMPWQRFRDEQLWTVEIDQIFKANRAGVDELFYLASGSDRLFSKDEAFELLRICQGLDASAFSSGVGAEQAVLTAYSLSKMTIDNEMAKYPNYHRMVKCEFYEFLARWSELAFREADYTLSEKLEKMLSIVLPLVKRKYVPPGEAEVDSESDYDDDIVNEIMSEVTGGVYQ